MKLKTIKILQKTKLYFGHKIEKPTLSYFLPQDLEK